MKKKRIVKFEKEGCAPCVMVSDFFKSHNVIFETINPFDNPELAMEFKIRTVPTTILIEEAKEPQTNKELMRVIGYQPSELTSLIGFMQ